MKWPITFWKWRIFWTCSILGKKAAGGETSFINPFALERHPAIAESGAMTNTRQSIKLIKTFFIPQALGLCFRKSLQFHRVMGKPRLKDILSCLILKLNNFAFWFWGENSKKNNLVFFLKVAHYQSHNPLFLFIVYNFSYFYQTNFSDGGIRNADLWCQKRPLNQLCHCPTFKKFFYSKSLDRKIKPTCKNVNTWVAQARQKWSEQEDSFGTSRVQISVERFHSTTSRPDGMDQMPRQVKVVAPLGPSVTCWHNRLAISPSHKKMVILEKVISAGNNHNWELSPSNGKILSFSSQGSIFGPLED